MSGHCSQILGDFRPQKFRPITEECTPHQPGRYHCNPHCCPAVLVIVLKVHILHLKWGSITSCLSEKQPAAAATLPPSYCCQAAAGAAKLPATAELPLPPLHCRSRRRRCRTATAAVPATLPPPLPSCCRPSLQSRFATTLLTHCCRCPTAAASAAALQPPPPPPCRCAAGLRRSFAATSLLPLPMPRCCQQRRCLHFHCFCHCCHHCHFRHCCRRCF
jgi:hypothetical protein